MTGKALKAHIEIGMASGKFWLAHSKLMTER